MKTKWIAAGIAAALVIGSAYWYLRSTVTFENDSACVLTGTTIRMGGEAVWTGTLKARDSVTVRIRPEHDAGFRVVGSCDGRPLDSGWLGYVSSGPPEDHTIRYSNNRFTYRRHGKI